VTQASSAYWDWVREQAQLIKADGCSGVPEINRVCCLEHDLAYFYGRSPQAAFVTKSWSLAAKCSRSDADARFRECNEDHSKLSRASLLAKWRWLGVRVGGWNAWRKHRQVRP
jgi:hypothetical protein